MSEHDPYAPKGDAASDMKESQAPDMEESLEAAATTETESETPAKERSELETEPREEATAADVDQTQDGDDDHTSAGVPKGTTKEVLAWVGYNKDRAQAALDAENASGEPRKGLTYSLNELLG